MRKKLENSHIPIVTDNAKENINAFYDDCNTARK